MPENRISAVFMVKCCFGGANTGLFFYGLIRYLHKVKCNRGRRPMHNALPAGLKRGSEKKKISHKKGFYGGHSNGKRLKNGRFQGIGRCIRRVDRSGMAAGVKRMGRLFDRIGVGNPFIHVDGDLTKPQGVVWLY